MFTYAKKEQLFVNAQPSSLLLPVTILRYKGKASWHAAHALRRFLESTRPPVPTTNPPGHHAQSQTVWLMHP